MCNCPEYHWLQSMCAEILGLVCL
uniref:Uncharacterized protein n=1 Tax=Arundo donax TaxID=35708 RepID=A0A0A8Z5Y7_ARUDO